jgi:predicted PolB exonuclease-like 3'-5' exonuclease
MVKKIALGKMEQNNQILIKKITKNVLQQNNQTVSWTQKYPKLLWII